MALDWNNLLNAQRIRPATTQDHRSEFRRDFDRIAFCTPFRRLQDKAQVFPLEPHDGVRTRLTHSIEVSIVARGIASAVTQDIVSKGHLGSDPAASLQKALNIQEIAATCGLLHDLGNPPFGHVGEEAIRSWFRGKAKKLFPKAGKEEKPKKRTKTGVSSEALTRGTQKAEDFLQFEGNPQTLRLLISLQLLFDRQLNLTYGTLSAARKYLAPSDSLNNSHQAFKKPSYFLSEETVLEEVAKKTGTQNLRNPITVIVEAADDIVYSFVDLEDAVRKNVGTWQEALQELDKELNSRGKDDPFRTIFDKLLANVNSFAHEDARQSREWRPRI